MKPPSQSDVIKRWNRAGEAARDLDAERRRVLSLLPWCCALSLALGLLIGYGLWGAA